MFFSRSLFNISLNILSRLSSLLSHPPLLHTLPKTLNISQRRNAKALQTIASIILLGKTSELYIQSNDYTGFHCIRVCTYNFINGIYDTFPNHLISQTISTLLQRIETRGINPVFTWYLPVHIHIHPNASVIKVHLHFPLSFHTFITLPPPALSPSTLAKQPLTPNTRG